MKSVSKSGKNDYNNGITFHKANILILKWTNPFFCNVINVRPST